eukprot:1912999-Rhodomonas_salina.1
MSRALANSSVITYGRSSIPHYHTYGRSSIPHVSTAPISVASYPRQYRCLANTQQAAFQAGDATLSVDLDTLAVAFWAPSHAMSAPDTPESHVISPEHCSGAISVSTGARYVSTGRRA